MIMTIGHLRAIINDLPGDSIIRIRPSVVDDEILGEGYSVFYLDLKGIEIEGTSLVGEDPSLAIDVEFKRSVNEKYEGLEY